MASNVDLPVIPGLSDAVLRAADLAEIGVAVTMLGPDLPRNVYVSEAAARITGYSRDELLSRGAFSNIAPEEQQRVAALASQRSAGGLPPLKLETVVVQPNGTRVPIATIAIQLELVGATANFSFFWDISERRAAEDARKAEADRLSRLVESAPDGIVLSRGSRLLSANPAALRLLGVESEAALVGRSLEEFIHPEDHRLMHERMRRSMAGGPLTAQPYRVCRPDGKQFLVEVTSLPFEHEGQPALLAFVRDVTERAAAHAQLARAERLASLGTIAAGIAHEINNPLTVAALRAEQLEEQLTLSGAPTGQLTAIAELRAMQDRIAFIVRDLKAFSRVDDDRRELVELSAVFAGVERLVDAAFHGKAKLTSQLGELPRVEANAARLEQVFVNLLLNALQALPPGRESNAVEVRGSFDDTNRVCVEVIDNGQGIPPEDLARVFDPFFTTKPAEIGTGLGLTVCHNIVTRFGGEIRVQSAVGQGTTVRVSFPAAPSETPLPFRLPPAARRIKVLVIDDQPSLARSLQLLLADATHDVEALSDGEQAIERLTGSERFDVVLCDLMMPGPTGMELYQRVVARRPELGPRFVFITGGAFTAAAEAFLQRVAPPVLTKPFRAPQLEEAIREALGRAGPT